jgi:hypothetical protein
MRHAKAASLLVGSFLVAVPAIAQVSIPLNGIRRIDAPKPQATAAAAPWRLNRAPIFYAGTYFYPAGATVFFDGRTMTPSDVYDGVTLYADITLEPFSVVYVPIGRGLMQPYERRRDGGLAGTTGSRTPSFPVQVDTESSRPLEPPFEAARAVGFEPAEATGHHRHGHVHMNEPRRENREAAAAEPEPFTAAGVVTIVPSTYQSPGSARTFVNADLVTPAQRLDVWIEFDGARWYSDGSSTPYEARRFEPAGNYRGFPVYREPGSATRIFVRTVLPDGGLAPFIRR